MFVYGRVKFRNFTFGLKKAIIFRTEDKIYCGELQCCRKNDF